MYLFVKFAYLIQLIIQLISEAWNVPNHHEVTLDTRRSYIDLSVSYWWQH